jgi:hypothetical protein
MSFAGEVGFGWGRLPVSCACGLLTLGSVWVGAGRQLEHVKTFVSQTLTRVLTLSQLTR